mmetsp:Transcript_170266/g.546092  ORF Transcript_170266/g.546092 Transcript_170266/m.546092 type:complete len:224 (-) Transcript_170266:1342-2013(-)
MSPVVSDFARSTSERQVRERLEAPYVRGCPLCRDPGPIRHRLLLVGRAESVQNVFVHVGHFLPHGHVRELQCRLHPRRPPCHRPLGHRQELCHDVALARLGLELSLRLVGRLGRQEPQARQVSQSAEDVPFHQAFASFEGVHPLHRREFVLLFADPRLPLLLLHVGFCLVVGLRARAGLSSSKIGVLRGIGPLFGGAHGRGLYAAHRHQQRSRGHTWKWPIDT